MTVNDYDFYTAIRQYHLLNCSDLCTKQTAMPARFYEQDIKAGLKNKRKLSAFLDSLVLKHRGQMKKVQLNYIFCGDAYLLEMNQQFLDHDTFTDIITFDLSNASDELQGEIYVSIERVRENAAKFAVSYDDELHRVIFHGALHLCGFKDKKAADIKEMRAQEDKCLENYQKENA
jgi:rRNA maturation RNase YbeY